MTAVVTILYPGLYSLVLGEGLLTSVRVFGRLYAFTE